MLHRLFEEELERRKAEHGESDVRTARAACDLGMFLVQQGDRSAAGDALALAAKTPDAEVAARALGALGGLSEQAGDRGGAAGFYRQALAKEEVASGKNSLRVAVRLNALARVVEPPVGIALLERALEIDTARLGLRHIETATIEANLAGLLLSAGRTDRALGLIQHATSVFQEKLGPDHPKTGMAAEILASASAARPKR